MQGTNGKLSYHPTTVTEINTECKKPHAIGVSQVQYDELRIWKNVYVKFSAYSARKCVGLALEVPGDELMKILKTKADK